MYYNGLGVDTDVAQAFAFYLQSAEQDFVEAQYNVGLMYSLGEGVLKDEIQSFMDIYARKNKRGGAWMADYQPLMNAQKPVAFVVCNLNSPTK
ncbi:MAG: hypothetical protein HAW58_06265, partial [Candidatus Thioglobus sp.]|nr:hypothetical protein [Candidatus Thioglobus sp.]